MRLFELLDITQTNIPVIVKKISNMSVTTIDKFKIINFKDKEIINQYVDNGVLIISIRE